MATTTSSSMAATTITELAEALQQAREEKLYDEVLHINGRTERHYALNNQMEYFAEQSEACFGTNDFYPFVRSELQNARSTDVCAL